MRAYLRLGRCGQQVPDALIRLCRQCVAQLRAMPCSGSVPSDREPPAAVWRSGRPNLREVRRRARATPETMLADELFLLLEGVRVTAQSVGPKGLGDRLVRMGEAMINAHTKIETARSVN